MTGPDLHNGQGCVAPVISIQLSAPQSLGFAESYPVHAQPSSWLRISEEPHTDILETLWPNSYPALLLICFANYSSFGIHKLSSLLPQLKGSAVLCLSSTSVACPQAYSGDRHEAHIIGFLPSRVTGFYHLLSNAS